MEYTNLSKVAMVFIENLRANIDNYREEGLLSNIQSVMIDTIDMLKNELSSMGLADTYDVDYSPSISDLELIIGEKFKKPSTPVEAFKLRVYLYFKERFNCSLDNVELTEDIYNKCSPIFNGVIDTLHSKTYTQLNDTIKALYVEYLNSIDKLCEYYNLSNYNVADIGRDLRILKFSKPVVGEMYSSIDDIKNKKYIKR